MKRKSLVILSLLMALSLVSAAWAGPLAASSAFSDGSAVAIHLGSGIYNNIPAYPNTSTKFTYTSSAPAVATVNPATGDVTAVAEGVTNIVATSVASPENKISYMLTVKGAGNYAVGDFGPSGVGRVFYVSADGSHGLEVARRGWKGVDDSNFQVAWQTTNVDTPNAVGTAVGTGVANSAALANDPAAKALHPAAAACKDYAGDGKTDCFLPSQDELRLAIKLGYIDAPLPTSHFTVIYWSSTQVDAGNAFGARFGNGKSTTPKATKCFVRPVRAF